MLRIRVAPELLDRGCDPRNFFDLNGQPYVIVKDQDPVDILVVMPWTCTDQNIQIKKQISHTISVELDIWHGFENSIQHMHDHCKNAGLPYAGNHYLITHMLGDSEVDCDNIIFTDHCFNKSKAAYTHFPYHPEWIFTDWSGPYTYIMPRLTNRSHQKVFLAPNRVDTARADHQVRSRFALHELIQKGYHDFGYFSNGSNYLHSHHAHPNIRDINFLKSRPKSIIKSFGQGIHNAYYEDTFISIYGETMEYGTTTLVTEKTYDPLAKGHFILPFSMQNYLDLVKSRGFELPTFIDYTYDTIENFDLRLAAYIKEAERLMQIPVEQWQELYQKNIEMLYHNQLVFHKRDYQRIDSHKILTNHR